MITNFFTKLFLNESRNEPVFISSEDPNRKRKVKIKRHIPRLLKWTEGKEMVITAAACLILLMSLWFGGMIFSTWSPVKFFAKVDMSDDLELPGKNTFDKNAKNR